MLHVAFNFISGQVKADELIPQFNHATDWYRYAPNCWLMWTTGTPEKWFKFLRPHIDAKDTMLIVEVKPDQHFGVLQQGAWDWLKKYI